VDAESARLKRGGVVPREVATRLHVPHHWEATRSRERGNVVPYVYEEDGLRRIAWSVAAERPAREARTEAEKAADKAAKRRAKLVRSARDKMRAALRRRFDDGWFDGRPALDILAEQYIPRVFRRGWYEDELVDAFAAAFDDATYCLDGDEAEAYRAESGVSDGGDGAESPETGTGAATIAPNFADDKTPAPSADAPQSRKCASGAKGGNAETRKRGNGGRAMNDRMRNEVLAVVMSMIGCSVMPGRSIGQTK
jgi:hypothetical protein